MSERTRLASAANMGLARLYCETCKSEELHRMQACVHCGTTAGIKRRESKWQYKDGLQIKKRRA